MFKTIFYHHFFNTNSPSYLSKINLFFYINIRIFKIKLYNYLNLLITNLSSFKFKKLSIYFNFFLFEKIYIIFLQYVFCLFILLIVL